MFKGLPSLIRIVRVSFLGAD